jgi:hypothetical protein
MIDVQISRTKKRVELVLSIAGEQIWHLSFGPSRKEMPMTDEELNEQAVKWLMQKINPSFHTFD